MDDNSEPSVGVVTGNTGDLSSQRNRDDEIKFEWTE